MALKFQIILIIFECPKKPYFYDNFGIIPKNNFFFPVGGHDLVTGVIEILDMKSASGVLPLGLIIKMILQLVPFYGHNVSAT